MVRHIATPLAVAFALVAGACAPAAPPVNDPADLAKITTLRNGFVTAMNSGDAAAFTNLYTPDGISMPNHDRTMTGRDAIVEGQKGIFGQVSIKAELAADETRTMGDFGFDRGSYKMTLTPKAGGEPMVQEGRYLVLLQKQADGSWKVTRDIDNSTMPMPMPMPPPPPAAAEEMKPGPAGRK